MDPQQRTLFLARVEDIRRRMQEPGPLSAGSDGSEQTNESEFQRHVYERIRNLRIRLNLPLHPVRPSTDYCGASRSPRSLRSQEMADGGWKGPWMVQADQHSASNTTSKAKGSSHKDEYLDNVRVVTDTVSQNPTKSIAKTPSHSNHTENNLDKDNKFNRHQAVTREVSSDDIPITTEQFKRNESRGNILEPSDTKQIYSGADMIGRPRAKIQGVETRSHYHEGDSAHDEDDYYSDDGSIDQIINFAKMVRRAPTVSQIHKVLMPTGVVPDGITCAMQSKEARAIVGSRAKWGEKALVAAHRSKKLKKVMRQCLGSGHLYFDRFDKDKPFTHLQKVMRAYLDAESVPLRSYYVAENLGVKLSSENLQLPSPEISYATSFKQHAFQCDLLFPPPDPHLEWFEDELLCIHIMRLVAAAIDPMFQSDIRDLCREHRGSHKAAKIKSFTRMIAKMKNPTDHGNLPWPRPLHNLDVVRNCCTFDIAEEVRDFARALCELPSCEGGLVRVKNGFQAGHERSSTYRALLINVRYAPDGLTYGALAHNPRVHNLLRTALDSLPDDPDESKSRWHSQMAKAVAFLRSNALRHMPVSFICEVQCTLRPYLSARKQFHDPYKIIRASNHHDLRAQFSRMSVENGSKWTIWQQKRKDMQLGCVRSGSSLLEQLMTGCQDGAEEAVQALLALRQHDNSLYRQTDRNGNNLIHNACSGGHLAIIKMLFQDMARLEAEQLPTILRLQESVINQGNNFYITPLYMACLGGHCALVRYLLKQDNIDIYKEDEKGRSPLTIANYKGHWSVVRLIKAHATHNITPQEVTANYGRNHTITICFDFVSNVPSRMKKITVVYAFAQDENVKTKVRMIPPAQRKTRDGAFIFSQKRTLKKVPAPTVDSACPRILLELQSVPESSKTKKVSNVPLGWTALDLFVPNIPGEKNTLMVVNEGYHRLPIQRGQISFSQADNIRLPVDDHMCIFVRTIYDGNELFELPKAKNKIELIKDKYTLPSSIQNVPIWIREKESGVKKKLRKEMRRNLIVKKLQNAEF